MPVRATALWPGSWTSVLDKTRRSRSTEVGRIWEVSDEHLHFVPQAFLDGVSLLYGLEVYPMPGESDLLLLKSLFSLLFRWLVVPPLIGVLGAVARVARFRSTVLGGPVVGKACADFAGADDGQFVHLYQDRSIAGLVTRRRRLRCVLEVLDGITRNGISLTRCLGLGAQRGAVLAAGPQGPVCSGLGC